MWQAVWLMGTTISTLPTKYQLPARPCTAGMARLRRHLTLIAAGLFPSSDGLAELVCMCSQREHAHAARRACAHAGQY